MKSSKTFRTLCLAFACAAFTFSLAVSVQAQTVTYLGHFDRVNGKGPSGPVIQASDGNFYGTTVYGGVNAQGNVFRMTPSGKITSIYSFCSKANCADGQYPTAGPVLGTDGNLYGVTYSRRRQHELGNHLQDDCSAESSRPSTHSTAVPMRKR